MSKWIINLSTTHILYIDKVDCVLVENGLLQLINEDGETIGVFSLENILGAYELQTDEE